jgi:hypothetical protein
MSDTYTIRDAHCIAQHKRQPHGAIISITIVAPEFGRRPVIIPFSQVHEDSPVWHEGDAGDCIVTAWIAAQRGWLGAQ